MMMISLIKVFADSSTSMLCKSKGFWAAESKSTEAETLHFENQPQITPCLKSSFLAAEGGHAISDFLTAYIYGIYAVRQMIDIQSLQSGMKKEALIMFAEW